MDWKHATSVVKENRSLPPWTKSTGPNHCDHRLPVGKQPVDHLLVKLVADDSPVSSTMPYNFRRKIHPILERCNDDDDVVAKRKKRKNNNNKVTKVSRLKLP